MDRNKTVRHRAGVLAALPLSWTHARQAAPAPVTPATMERIATVDERFQSYKSRWWQWSADGSGSRT